MKLFAFILSLFVVLGLTASAFSADKVYIKPLMQDLKANAKIVGEAVAKTNYAAAIPALEKMAKDFASLTNAKPPKGDQSVWTALQFQEFNATLAALAAAKVSNYAAFSSNVNVMWATSKQGHETFMDKKDKKDDKNEKKDKGDTNAMKGMKGM